MEIILLLMILLVVFGEYTKYKQRKNSGVVDTKVEQESVLEEVIQVQKHYTINKNDVIDFMSSDGDSVILILLCVDLNYRIGHDCNNLHKINSREYKLSLLN